MQKFIFLNLALALSLTGGGLGFAEQAQEPVPSINVRGEGRVQAEPDEAVITFGVTSEDKSLQKAYRDNTAKMNAMIETVKKTGVDPKDLQTSEFSMYPLYENNMKTGRALKPSGFSVSQQLTVKLRDLSKAGPLIDSVVSDGANTFHGIQFSSSRMAELAKEAKIKAAKSAKENAALLAESLEVTLGQLLEVNDEMASPYPVMMKAARMEMSADMGAPQIQAGSIEVTASCSVKYAIGSAVRDKGL